MDQNYILLCAESAYNTVIIENVLCEDYEIIQEGSAAEFAKAAKEKIVKIGQGFISAVKSLATRVLNAIKEAWTKIKNSKAVTELQNRAKAVKAKMSSKKKAETKQESASLYDQLMEMVLTEEDNSSSKYINFIKVFDHMRNCTDEILKQSYAFSSSFYQKSLKNIDDSVKYSISFTKSAFANENDVDKAIEKIKNNQEETNKILNSATEEGLKAYIDKFKFKYSKPSSIDQIGSAITKEYQGCKEDYTITEDNDLDNGEILDITNAVFIDGYASALADQFKQAKVMFDNAIKNMEALTKDVESTINAEHFSDNAKLNTAIINSLIADTKMGQSLGYKIAISLSKAATASAAIFTKISTEAINQTNRIISEYENMYNIA